MDSNYSKIRLETISDMVVDETGLIHGGFIFSLADYASMVAINHPNVVLGSANVKFLKPVKVGEILIAEGKFTRIEGKKRVVEVEVRKDKEVVFKGDFICYIPEKHVLNEGGKK
ncbi:MAG: hotdog domain-containing protein [Candidatus Hermodarchaeota archaeon]